MFGPMAEYFGMKTWHVPFPHWQTITWQVALFFVLEDAYHFVGACWNLTYTKPAL